MVRQSHEFVLPLSMHAFKDGKAGVRVLELPAPKHRLVQEYASSSSPVLLFLRTLGGGASAAGLSTEACREPLVGFWVTTTYMGSRVAAVVSSWLVSPLDS